MNSYTIQYGDTLSGIASKTGKSIQELMRLNPSITDPNKIQAGRTLNVGDNAPAPAPTPAPAATSQKQTIAQVAKVSVPTYVEDSTTTKIGNNLRDQATEKVNEEAIRAATRARIQGQIDAINAAVQDQIFNFRNTTGKNRQGQSYALAAAGGRIGSATGEAEFRTTEDYNNQEEQTYRSEANVKISQLLGASMRDAQTEIEAKRAAIKEGADNIIGNRTKVKVVKNKLAPPFKVVEFDIMYGEGISKTGELVDLGVKALALPAGKWLRTQPKMARRAASPSASPSAQPSHSEKMRRRRDSSVRSTVSHTCCTRPAI